MENKFHASLQQAIEQLRKETPLPYTVLMQQGSMSLEYFAPDKIDIQTPHKQDELYIIVRGSGFFYRNDQIISFKAGDVLFVPAGMEHHFENFTDDFATWVIFYGPEGGENNQIN